MKQLKKNTKYLCFLIFLQCLICYEAYAQLGEGTYTSAKVHNNGDYDKLESLNGLKGLFDLKDGELAYSGGIKAHSFGPNGRVELKIYNLEPNYNYGDDSSMGEWRYFDRWPSEDQRGQLVYSIYSDSDSDGFIAKPNSVTIPQGREHLSELHIPGTELKKLMQYAEPQFGLKCTEYYKVGFFEWFTLSSGELEWYKYRCAGGPLQGDYKFKYTKYRFIVELTIRDAIVEEISLPLVEESVNPADYFNVNSVLQVSVNDELVYSSSDAGREVPEVPVIDLTMGDKVTFTVTNAGGLIPEVTGVPQVWQSFFSGESKYYCSPSVTPGEFNPWIGFDSNVHGSALRSGSTTNVVELLN